MSNQIQSSKSKNFVIGIWDLIGNLTFDIWHSKSLSLGIILIAVGAISNIIDRIYFSCVIDFIDLRFWPVFNLADVYITVGGIMILALLVRTTDSH